MPFIYCLFSEKDQGWYIGQTITDPHVRFNFHSLGKVKSTKHRRPLKLAYVEEHPSRQNVMKREWHLKHPKGYKEKLEICAMLSETKEKWPVSVAQLAPKGALRA